MEDHEPPPTTAPGWRRIPIIVARVAALGLAVTVAASLGGQAIRDRSVATALLMYIPTPLVGASAVVLDLACGGRSIPRPRFGLSGLGLAAISWSVGSMVGFGTTEGPRPGDREISVLSWNVLWGGFPHRSVFTWAVQCRAIEDRGPDLIVLSEAPHGAWLARLVEDLGPGASIAVLEHGPESPYWYRLAVCSRWMVRSEGRIPLDGGAGMIVAAEVRGRRLRLLVVDGISTPTRSRLPFLRGIAAACREARGAGRPFDLVLGDFNTPSRSLGFDDLEEMGYRLAGRSALGWRGTFPAWIPVYDIDHIWLGPGLRLGSCTFFNGPFSDHRGQVVRVLMPEEPLE